jgi:long-subunit acyl-CoA synthetase (AMP-forming)
MDKMQKSNALSRMMFNYGLSSRQQAARQSVPQASSPFWHRWVFQKISSTFGGRLRILVSAAAPLSVETAEFLRTALCPVVQLYAIPTF